MEYRTVPPMTDYGSVIRSVTTQTIFSLQNTEIECEIISHFMLSVGFQPVWSMKLGPVDVAP